MDTGALSPFGGGGGWKMGARAPLDLLLPLFSNQIASAEPIKPWEDVFGRIINSESKAEVQAILDDYLNWQPSDPIATWLREHVGQWVPQRGIYLCERPITDVHS